jgi:drug/metabolite transporter (DMT)-like permease
LLVSTRGASRAYLALAAAGLLWGTSFLLAKIALAELTVAHMLLYRLSLAAVAFVPILAMQGTAIRREDWLTLLAAAVLGVPLVFLVQFEGVARTTVSHAALMVGTSPMLIGLAAARFAKERLTRRGLALLVASTAGALLIVFGTPAAHGGQRPTVVGDLLVFLSLFATVGWVLLSKKLMTKYPPSVVTATVMAGGTILLDAWVLTTSGVPPFQLSRNVWLALAAQGLLCTTAATLLWNWGVSQVPAAQAGLFVNLEPALGALLGVMVLGETLGWGGMAGGAIIIGAAAAAATETT